MRTQHRWIWLILVGAFIAGLWIVQGSPAQAAEKSLVWDRFDVDIIVNADGAFDVAEHQAIRFLDGEFTFGYRSIPKQNFSALTDWSVTDASGHVYTEAYGGQEPYTFVVDDQGDEYVVHWYFPRTDQPETYTLKYTVQDGLRYYDGGDQVWWNAIYGDRQFPVRAGRVRVIVPAPAVIDKFAAYINGDDAGSAVTTELLDENRAVIFDLTESLAAGEELQSRVQFTHGVVAGAPPYWQQAADQEVARQEAERALRDRWAPLVTVAFGTLGLLLFFGGPILVYLLWYKLGPRQACRPCGRLPARTAG